MEKYTFIPANRDAGCVIFPERDHHGCPKAGVHVWRYDLIIAWAIDENGNPFPVTQYGVVTGKVAVSNRVSIRYGSHIFRRREELLLHMIAEFRARKL